MQAASLPADEIGRLEALYALDVLDSDAEPVFDRIVGLARELSGADVAAMTLLDADRLWFKSMDGVAVQSVARELAFCAHAVFAGEVLWVEDAALDVRFAGHAFVTGDAIRFYAGAPLLTAKGLALGALCVMDARPRPFDPTLSARLRSLAALIVEALNQRTARRHSEQQIARALVRHAPTSLSILDRDLRFLMVSEKGEAEAGVPEAELVGRSVFDMFPAVRAVEPLMRRALAGETLSGKRAPLRQRGGSVAICDWEVAPWRTPDGAIGGIRVMTFDLTELVRSQEAASRSEARLKLALDVADTLVFEFNARTGRLQSVGDADRFFEAVEDHAFYAEDLSRAVHPDDQARVAAEWRAGVAGAESFQLEYRIARNSGEDFWVQASHQVFRDPQGRTERIIGVLRNVTQRKQKDLALERALEAAETANRVKSEFLANMSHEIRTPLNGVLGVAGALRRSELPPEQNDMVRLIEASAQNLERLLSDVLDLARIEAGRLELHHEDFSLSELLGTTAALFAKQAQEKGIGFQYDQTAVLAGKHTGDPVRLRQILSNLLSNAVKFTPSGCVTLRVEAARPKAGRQRLCVSVIDTGVGFDEATRGRLFQRFEQADGSITRRFGGTGLGLAICRSLADAMKAGIDVNSVVGGGSCFSLSLDLDHAAEAAEAPIAPAKAAAATPPRELRILLAEDHPINRKVVELILSVAEAALSVAADGAQAVECFLNRGPFDLVLMDMQMPVMDGLSAIRAIRAHERRLGMRRTPIICLTANAMPEHVQAAHEAGADGHLSKPIAAAVLLGLVDEMRLAIEAPAPLALSA